MHFIEPDWPAPAGIFAISTTRTGGVSQAPWDSFNLGDHVGDEGAAVETNRRLLMNHLPRDTHVQWLRQVHGVEVVAAGTGAPPEADASWTSTPGLACAIMTADCLPVLFCNSGGTTVAAAHAGWRGLCAGVLEATLEAMPVASEEVMAWLGPAIGPAAFEVGGEVREAFLASNPQAESCFLPSGRAGRHLADIYHLARQRLTESGVTSIYGGGECTFSDSDRFYSYRRDGQTGRMATLIGISPR